MNVRNLVLLLVISLGLLGCGGSTPEPIASAPAVESRAEEQKPTVTKEDSAQEEETHHHAHIAPHGGSLIPIGDHFANLELVFDATNSLIVAYILDGCAENSIRITQPELKITVQDQEIRLNATPNMLTGETAGDTSMFLLKVDKLPEGPDFKGSIEKITIRGETFENIPFSFTEH